MRAQAQPRGVERSFGLRAGGKLPVSTRMSAPFRAHVAGDDSSMARSAYEWVVCFLVGGWECGGRFRPGLPPRSALVSCPRARQECVEELYGIGVGAGDRPRFTVMRLARVPGQ